MKIFNYIKAKFPFELKRGASILTIILTLIITGIFTRLGEKILDAILSYIKPNLPKIWNTFSLFVSISFDVKLIWIIVFIILLFPIYRILDKIYYSNFRNKIVFEDDFNEGNKGWILNFWGSNNPQKTNRIENSTMIFEATESDLVDPRKEFGSFIDIRYGIYKKYTYEVMCEVKSEEYTTMQFRLWLHDTLGTAPNVATPFKTPSISGDKMKLKIMANSTEAIRIHLHNKAGSGKILVDKVVVRKI